MIFDYYASLAEVKACPKLVNESGLTSGFVDRCLVWSYRNGKKNEARQCYMKRSAELAKEDFKFGDHIKQSFEFPKDFEPDFSRLLDSTWFSIDVSFTLKSPWYSKDDRPFHVLDNPVRKDRVFGVPFMSAASWKGLLRWACRMQAGLSGHLEKHDMKMDGWKDPSWIVHLFGNEKGAQQDFRSGSLVFYPTWFKTIGFEVINPHSRTHRAGTHPIYYEVVPAETKGRLRLLYAPLPGEIENYSIKPADFVDCLIDSIKALLERYGISAKRTAGWGTARIEDKESKLYYVEGGCLNELIGEAATTSQYVPPNETLKSLMDEKGSPLSSLLDENENLLSKTQFKKLPGEKLCSNRVFEEFVKWYETHGDRHKSHLKANKEDTPWPQTTKISFDKLMDILKNDEDARKGGDQ